MNAEEAKRIHAEGPKHDVGVDAEFYIALGYLKCYQKAIEMEAAIKHRIRSYEEKPAWPMSKGEVVTMKHIIEKWEASK